MLLHSSPTILSSSQFVGSKDEEKERWSSTSQTTVGATEGNVLGLWDLVGLTIARGNPTPNITSTVGVLLSSNCQLCVGVAFLESSWIITQYSSSFTRSYYDKVTKAANNKMKPPATASRRPPCSYVGVKTIMSIPFVALQSNRVDSNLFTVISIPGLTLFVIAFSLSWSVTTRHPSPSNIYRTNSVFASEVVSVQVPDRTWDGHSRMPNDSHSI
jgi:hypothetical protein